MFPGDPNGGAAEVINCRCALLQRARWALDDESEELKQRAEFFGLDPSKPEDREKFQNIIDDIIETKDELRIGFWRGQKEDALFHIKGNDVVITTQDNEFVTLIKDGATNVRGKNARNK